MKLTAPPPTTEAEFQKQILQAARTFGWLRYHTSFSLGSSPGFPDLVLVKAPRVIFAELKRQSGNTTPEQDVWLACLRECPGIETYLWRPNDLEAAVAILMQGNNE